MHSGWPQTPNSRNVCSSQCWLRGAFAGLVVTAYCSNAALTFSLRTVCQNRSPQNRSQLISIKLGIRRSSLCHRRLSHGRLAPPLVGFLEIPSKGQGARVQEKQTAQR